MSSKYRGAVSRVLIGALLIPSLLVLALPATALADETHYPDTDLETWLNDTIASSQVTVTTPPAVTLDPDLGRMIVDSFAFEVRGVSVGLSYLRVSPTGTDTSVAVAGELDILGKHPRFSCDLTLEFLEATGRLQVASVNNVEIAGYTPDLSAGDLEAIVDCLNHVLESSELSISPPGADLETISIVDDGGTAKLQTTWSGGGTGRVETAEVESKLSGMADTLASKANSYLSAESPDWSAAVVAESELLKVDLGLSLCGKEITLHTEFSFSGLDFTFTDSTLSAGSKTVTFSGSGQLGATDYVPWTAMGALGLNDTHPGLRDLVADVEDVLLDALDDMFTAFAENTGITLDVRVMTAVSVEGTDVVVEGACLIEGDVNMDGQTNIVDAMFIAQFTVGLRELDPDQMTCADTTDDGAVNIVDAMHVAQFTVDPYGTADILMKPVWEFDSDEGVTTDPLDL